MQPSADFAATSHVAAPAASTVKVDAGSTQTAVVRLFVVWLCSAVLVIAVRFAAPIGPLSDTGMQLQASHNLIVGRGLTVYQDLIVGRSDADLGTPAQPVTLTYFPLGYSVLAAALLWTGIGVGVTVKILGALATFLGWWGWSRLALAYVGDGITRRSWKWVAFAIAITSPLLFTPPWSGTDIFLWAVVPWALDLIVRAADDRPPRRWWLDCGAGALCGFAFLMRYASLFLAAYAGCVVLWQAHRRPKVLIGRWLAFVVGLLPALALQGHVNYILATSRAQPGGLLNQIPTNVLQRIVHAIRLLRTTNYLWAFWMPGEVGSRFYTGTRAATPWQVALALMASLCLFVGLRGYGRDAPPACRDRRVVAAGLFVAIPVVLLGCMMVGSTDYLAERRYYVPAVPLSVFVAYSIATGVRVPSRLSRFVVTLWTLYLVGYVAMSAVYAVFLFAPGRIGALQRSKLVGDVIARWPSMAMSYDLSPARALVMQRLRAAPDTLLLMRNGGAFYWDPEVNQSRVRGLSCGGTADHLNGPADIVIFTADAGGDDALWGYSPTAVENRQRASCFEGLPGLRLVRRFPLEGVKVLEAHVAPGQRVELHQ